MFADDCEKVLRLLIDEGPQTMDDLIAKTGFPQWTINELLTDMLLSGCVRPYKDRVKNRKATFYEYKLKG